MQTPQDGKKREQFLAQRPAVSGRKALRCRQLFNEEMGAPPTTFSRKQDSESTGGPASVCSQAPGTNEVLHKLLSSMTAQLKFFKTP